MKLANEQVTQLYAATEKPTVHLPLSWYLELMSLLFSYLAAEVKGCIALTLKRQNKVRKSGTTPNKEKKLAQGWAERFV